jgi:prepilin-type processing-associated H-X9-DG protein/prepilin-type N-terminal cleavage/methylation domain-containing protein
MLVMKPVATHFDRSRPGPRGFTLVELLVVIGIIAVLIGILLPVLGRVRKQAFAAECASNLRQLGVGFQNYANSFGGTAVPMRLAEERDADGGGSTYDLGNGPHYRPRWFDLLGARSKSFAYRSPPSDATEGDKTITNRAFLCPAVPDWDNGRNYVYGYNYQFLGNVRFKPDGSFINFPVRVTRLKTAETVLAADCMGTAAGKPAKNRKGYRRDGVGELAALGNHGYTLDPPRMTELCDYSEDNSRHPLDRSAPDPRHSNKANVLFCDGHVEAMTLVDMGYVVRPDGSVPALDPKANNKKFSGRGTDDDPPMVQ